MSTRIATIASPAPSNASRGLPVMLLAAFLFAILGLLIKLLGPAYRVWDIAFYRFAGGAVILYAVFRYRQNLFRPARPRLMLIRGLVGSIAFLCLTYAIQTIPLSTAMVLFYSFPAFAALFAPLLSNDRIQLYEVGCILLALAGVGIIFDFQMQGSLPGQVMAVVAAVFAGLTIALIRILRQTHGSVIIYFFLCLVGGAVSMGPFLAHPRLPQNGIELMIVGGILLTSIIAQILMNHAFKYCKSWEGGLFMTSEVVFAAIFGILFLNEEATWRFWIGGLLIFASAIAFNLQTRFAKWIATGHEQG
jgi:drug/metabolite transporter (DMT)-like permease